ncbi:MAG: DNA replication and repair protein RecF [Treponema sp.]|jgi:DNA replication and repair protein RecF|nr:DNA replication and repair protein RecF [Treponema sp.]
MFFSFLRTTAFRNLADAEIFTGAKNVFLVGENGQGKTNFLEALYFCAYASSFRAVRDSEIARNSGLTSGEKDFSAEVKIERSANSSILVKHEKGKKSITINGKHTDDRKDLLSIAPSIVFCHEDMEFVSGSPERRRWFFDQTLSLYDPVYLEDLRRYRRVLKSRNAVLKEYAQNRGKNSVEQVLDALDPQFAMYGQKLMEKREIASKEFSGVFEPLYKEVSGIAGITVQYIHSWKTEQDPLSFLQKRRPADMAAGLSLSGPHRDRYVFAHKGTEFAGKASTGQRRLLALLLRTAQTCRFSQMTNLNPVLLLDDVLLEMDGEKRQRFLAVLPACDQAFYAFLPEEPYQRYLQQNSPEDTLIYKVNAGMLSL